MVKRLIRSLKIKPLLLSPKSAKTSLTLNVSIARRRGTFAQTVGQREVVRKVRGQGAIGAARRAHQRVLHWQQRRQRI